MLNRADDIAQRFGRDMGISRRRGQPSMAEQDLDHPHIGVRFQQMRGKAVSQPVQCCGLFDPSHTLGRRERPVQLTGRYRVDTALAGKQPTLRAGLAPIIPL